MRFRTAVPATRDVAFVLAAVVVGMAIGAGQYWVSAIGLMTVALATQFNTSSTQSGNAWPTAADSWRLTLRVGLQATENLEAELERMTESHQLISAETARRGGALELVYSYQPRDGFDATKLIASLNSTANVEAASAKSVS